MKNTSSTYLDRKKEKLFKSIFNLAFFPGDFFSNKHIELLKRYAFIFLTAFFLFLFIYDRLIIVQDMLRPDLFSNVWTDFVKSYFRTGFVVLTRIIIWGLWLMLKVGFFIFLAELFWKSLKSKELISVFLYSQIPFLLYFVINIFSILIFKKIIEFQPNILILNVERGITVLGFFGILKIWSYILLFIGLKNKYKMTILIFCLYVAIPFFVDTFINKWVFIYG
jgi:hypothetical protein